MHRTKLLLLVPMLVGYMSSASAVGPGYLGNLSGNTYSIGHTFSALAHDSPFVDTYIFDIAPQSVTVGTTVTINLDMPFFPRPQFELLNMSIKFTDATGATIYDTDNQSNAADYTLAVSATLPAALGYKFVVAGDVTGNLGGSYGGVLQALPVPEPETHTMVLAGLCLIGTIWRRCKNAAWA
ncbi:FxDxF family PEP-CTERM protein [Nitrosovibrio tenuis]|uniref:PEP-CTERM motif-containing protein n=1 Tax=Nitrosovibrio tenuis TaxID=1233 RepID=A0A1H7RN63_9PROT|nr:FxDxF family PEP-CTERM protein [Nitrosovibrio tenuis]SEL61254.1 PEP-CTERM motif-containing protein [Nitrosovibrio tenuis]